MHTLAIDLGGSRVKMGLIDDGVIRETVIFPADSTAPLGGTLQETARRADGLLSRLSLRPEHVGLAFPGIVRGGKVVSCNGKYTGAVDFDWQAWSLERFGKPLDIVNDAAAALLGEMRFGAGRGSEDAVIMVIGTGIGAAAAIGGEVPEGKHHSLGMLGGHIAIEMLHPRRCTCGNIGCLEAWAGTWAVNELAHESPLLDQSCLRGVPYVDYRAIALGMEQNDPLSLQLFDQAAGALCMGAVNLVHAYGPEVLILSGGAAHIPALCERIAAYVRRHAWTPWGEVKVTPAENPDCSVLLGLHARSMTRGKSPAAEGAAP